MVARIRHGTPQEAVIPGDTCGDLAGLLDHLYTLQLLIHLSIPLTFLSICLYCIFGYLHLFFLITPHYYYGIFVT